MKLYPATKKWFTAALVGGVIGASSSASAAIIEQFGDAVVGFSSQFSAGSWSAAQALGAPNTFGYGDLVTAWAPAPINGTIETLTIGFNTAVFATGASVWETYGNGFVTQLEVRDAGGNYHLVWTGTDPSLPGTPVIFSATWAQTSYLVDALRITVNTNHNLSAWEEIDAVRLTGTDTASTNLPAPTVLALLGFGLLALRRRTR